MDTAKDGTTLQGLMNSLMISVSMGLQYGVPPEVYVSKLSHIRFEPSGMTNDEDIRIAKSIVDYIFRWMGKKFLSVDQQEELGILSTEVKARLAAGYANGGTGASAPATAEPPAAERAAGLTPIRPAYARSFAAGPLVPLPMHIDKDLVAARRKCASSEEHVNRRFEQGSPRAGESVR